MCEKLLNPIAGVPGHRHNECVFYPKHDAETALCGRRLVLVDGASQACARGMKRKEVPPEAARDSVDSERRENRT